MSEDQRAIRVLVVDDDSLAAAGITAILGTAPDLEVVGHCTDGEQVLDAVARIHPDVVLCDVKMPRVDGIAVARSLAGQPSERSGRAAGTPPRVLMMTAFDEDGRVLDAVNAGAAGFLGKDEDPRRIIDAVRTVAAGGEEYSPRAAKQLADWVRDDRAADARRDALARLDQLTDRERDFALALVTGASDAELAARFFVAETTVKSALASIKAKWGIRNRTQLAVIVARSGAE